MSLTMRQRLLHPARKSEMMLVYTAKAGFDWLSVAARRGNVAAQNKLAHLYINGIGTQADSIEAFNARRFV